MSIDLMEAVRRLEHTYGESGGLPPEIDAAIDALLEKAVQRAMLTDSQIKQPVPAKEHPGYPVKRKVIAVDFDGTLCEDNFPQIGSPRQNIIDALKIERFCGAKIILWTCRKGKRLMEAVEFCKQHNIALDAVNANLPEHIKRFGGDCRKVYADEYWDDRAYSVGPKA